ncbi:ABC transporter permease [Paenibacillus sp. KQZ6P-2]|uniref:ABC transporter permease n=1 Tax=Paenibacillus mangrovi TaxID=2931978 RepID=A0A9X2B417_9BACL|nr:ABC transporter permease subunit [Paenibacillus mangrovi]MCJ8014011.1 ABC transporter permease [Paenibacillus mangrovi]
MRNFNNLVINEWLKMSKKRSFFIPYAIIAVAMVVLAWAFKRWAEDMFGNAFEYTAMMASSNGFGHIVAMLAVIFTAGLVPSEHAQGTIKFLLIRGQSRGKVLASKYVAALLFILSMFVWLNVFGFASGAVLFGMEQPAGAWRDILIATGSSLVYSIVFMTLTFMLGVLTRSAGAAMGVGTAALMLSSLIIPKSFYKYVLFPNADLSVYSHGGHPPIEGMTLPFSIAVLAVYIVLFLGASFVTFKRRDIA